MRLSGLRWVLIALLWLAIIAFSHYSYPRYEVVQVPAGQKVESCILSRGKFSYTTRPLKEGEEPGITICRQTHWGREWVVTFQENP
jgi:hypothetical protein